jgi:hypothetical protein
LYSTSHKKLNKNTLNKGIKMDAIELNKMLEMHKLWLDSYGKDGEKADLRGADLRNANLYKANLRDANLRNANLYKANLRDADFQGADFQGADFQGADLRGANIDFSCLPLWCGGLNFTIDEKQARQIKYHIESIFQFSGFEYSKIDENKFHQVVDGNVPKLWK